MNQSYGPICAQGADCHVDLHNKDFCSDLSHYGPVIWTDADQICCETRLEKR